MRASCSRRWGLVATLFLTSGAALSTAAVVLGDTSLSLGSFESKSTSKTPPDSGKTTEEDAELTAVAELQVGPSGQVVEFAPIPEPSTGILLIGAGMFAAMRRGRRA